MVKEEEKSLKEQITEECERELKSFIRIVMPYAVMAPLHEDVCDFLTSKSEKSPYRLVLIPRAHRKSFLVGAAAAWEIVRNPAITILYLSATSDLAEAQLRFIKQTLESKKCRRYWPTLIQEDEGKREKWTSTEICVDHPSRKTQGIRDATVKAAGLTTNITGSHYDLIILDDLVVPSNNNTVGRRAVLEQYSQLQSILNPGGKIIAAGTRYDPSDLYSLLIAAKEEVYNNKGEFIGSRPQWAVFQKAVEVDGEFLWPRQKRASDGKWFGFDAGELARIRAGYEDKVQFYAQYYNNPNCVGSSQITSDMFNYYEPERLSRCGGNWSYGGNILNVYSAYDFAYTTRASSDWSVIATIGVDRDQNRFVLGIDRFKTDNIRDFYTHLVQVFDKWRFKKIRMEASTAQSLVIKELKNMLKEDGVVIRIEEYKPTRDKRERMMAVLKPLYEQGKILHYRGGNCGVLEEELSQARPAHDDTMNAVADAIEIGVAPTGTSYQKAVTTIQRLGRFGGSTR